MEKNTQVRMRTCAGKQLLLLANIAEPAEGLMEGPNTAGLKFLKMQMTK
jgi:hypothetical protein